jgi:hypothetical protein
MSSVLIILAVRAGFGTRVPLENAQVIQSNKQQKRSDRSFRRSEVHGPAARGATMINAAHPGRASNTVKRTCLYLRVSAASKTKRGSAA